MSIPKFARGNYFYDVLVMLSIIELFTNLIGENRNHAVLSIKIIEIAKGRKRLF